MSDSSRRSSGLSRRRFIATVSAGSAALLAQPLAAVAAAARRTSRKPTPTPPPPTPESTAFDQQRASTLSTLQVIRKHALPPGGDLGAVFHPLTNRRKAK